MKNQAHDNILLYRLQTKQDKEAFTQLYDKYYPDIHRFVLFKVPSAELADDIVAQVFEGLWMYVVDRKRITHFRALMYRIARNLIAHHYREAGKSRNIAIEYVELSVAQDNEGLAHVQREDLLAAFVELTEDQAELVQLRYIEGLPVKVVAEVVGKSRAAVSVGLRRANKRLKRFLDSDVHKKKK